MINMKKTVLLLIALIVMGAAQESMAQQRKAVRKTAVKKTTTSKQATAKKSAAPTTTASILMEGPATVDGAVAYLGIPVSEKANSVRAKLIAKGFVRKPQWEGDESLSGVVDGVRVRLDVSDYAGKGCIVRQYDAKSYSLAKAKARYESLLAKVVGIYGKGEYQTNDGNFKRYMIAGNRICIELFNEDEMEGDSPNYMIAVAFNPE